MHFGWNRPIEVKDFIIHLGDWKMDFGALFTLSTNFDYEWTNQFFTSSHR